MSQKYKGLDNRNLRLLNQSDAELVFQKHRKFIWVFSKAKTLEEAATRLKLSKSNTRSRAGYLRRMGVDLRRFNRRSMLLSKEQLSTLKTTATKLKPKNMDYEKFVRLWQAEGPLAVRREFSLSANQSSWIAGWLRTKCLIPLHRYNYNINRKELRRIALETATSSGSNIPPHKPPRPPQ